MLRANLDDIARKLVTHDGRMLGNIGKMCIRDSISLVELTRDIITIIIGRAEEAGIKWEYEKDKSIIPYPYIYGSPLPVSYTHLDVYKRQPRFRSVRSLSA